MIIKVKNTEVPEVLFVQLMKHFDGHVDLVVEWLIKPKRPLCECSPISKLGSENGLDEVLGLLERMSMGDFS